MVLGSNSLDASHYVQWHLRLQFADVAACPAGQLTPSTAQHCLLHTTSSTCGKHTAATGAVLLQPVVVPPPAHHLLACTGPNMLRPNAAKQANCTWPTPSSHLRQVRLQSPADDWALPPGCLWRAFLTPGHMAQGTKQQEPLRKLPECMQRQPLPCWSLWGTCDLSWLQQQCWKGGIRGRVAVNCKEPACMEPQAAAAAPSRE